MKEITPISRITAVTRMMVHSNVSKKKKQEKKLLEEERENIRLWHPLGWLAFKSNTIQRSPIANRILGQYPSVWDGLQDGMWNNMLK